MYVVVVVVTVATIVLSRGKKHTDTHTQTHMHNHIYHYYYYHYIYYVLGCCNWYLFPTRQDQIWHSRFAGTTISTGNPFRITRRGFKEYLNSSATRKRVFRSNRLCHSDPATRSCTLRPTQFMYSRKSIHIAKIETMQYDIRKPICTYAPHLQHSPGKYIIIIIEGVI